MSAVEAVKFSWSGPVSELSAKLAELQVSANTAVDAATLEAVKALAIARIKSQTLPNVTLHLRANIAPVLRSEQYEVQIVGMD